MASVVAVDLPPQSACSQASSSHEWEISVRLCQAHTGVDSHAVRVRSQMVVQCCVGGVPGARRLAPRTVLPEGPYPVG